MLSVASRCFGQVDACDSKRKYLCAIVGFMPPFRLRSSDRNVWGGCAVATREKSGALSKVICIAYIMHFT